MLIVLGPLLVLSRTMLLVEVLSKIVYGLVGIFAEVVVVVVVVVKRVASKVLLVLALLLRPDILDLDQNTDTQHHHIGHHFHVCCVHYVCVVWCVRV